MFAVSNYNAKGKWKDAILITIELVIVIAKKPESSFNDNHNRSLYIITEIFYFDMLKSQNKITKSQILSSMYTFWLEDFISWNNDENQLWKHKSAFVLH